MRLVEEISGVDQLQIEFIFQALLFKVQFTSLVSEVPQEGRVSSIESRWAVYCPIKVLPDKDIAIDVRERPLRNPSAELGRLQVRGSLPWDKSMVILGSTSVYADSSYKFVKDLIVDLFSILCLNLVFTPKVFHDKHQWFVFVFFVFMFVIMENIELVQNAIKCPHQELLAIFK